MPVAAPETLHGLPDPETDRWQPLRAGITNVFHYDEQTFVFHRGRLLIRGLNGSGKSVALEVLLPYLFDADLSPERLSTFGGRDRSMHWKLIGFDETGRDNARGYVWMEFGRAGEGGTPEYFTIGAGLEAVRSDRTRTKSWYWTTRQRVGVDLSLTSKQREPHTSAKLEEALGEHGTVHSSASAYRAAVNRTLFGLPDEAFRALRRMLHELRRPHLSQGLDPLKLSDLLSGSLPPVDATVIGQLAAGFDGLDRHATDVREMQDTIGHISSLLQSYRTYSRKNIKAALGRVLRAEIVYRTAVEARAAAQKDVDDATIRLSEAEEALQENRAAHERASGELRGLEDSEEFRAGRSLAEAEQQVNRAATAASAARERAGVSARRARQADVRAGEAKREAADSRMAMDARAAETRRAAARAGAEGAANDAAAALARGDVSEARHALGQGVRSRRTDLDAVRKMRQRAAESETAVASLRRQFDQVQEDLVEAQAADAHAVETLEAAREAFASEAGEWLVTAGMALETLDTFDLADSDAVAALVSDIATARRTALLAEEAMLTREREQLLSQRDALEGRREEVSRTDVVHPPASRTRRSRRTDHVGAALFLLVDFVPSVSFQERAGLEAALEASGLLDAWVTPDGRMLPGDAEDAALVGVAGTVAGTSLNDVLVAVPSQEVGEGTITGVLSQIAWIADSEEPLPGDPVAVMSADGRYRVGPLEGRWEKSAAQFIGGQAREGQRHQAAKELEAQLEALSDTLDGVEQRMERVTGRLRAVERDLACAPRGTAVRAALRDADRAVAVVDERTRAVAETGTRLQDAVDLLERARSEARAAARFAGVEEGELDDALWALDALTNTGREWVHAVEMHAQVAQAATIAQADAEATAREADSDGQAAAVAEAAAREEQARYATVKDALGSRYDEVVAAMAAARERLAALGADERALQEHRVELTGVSRDAAAALKERSAALSDRGVALEAAAEALLQLARLGALEAAGLAEHIPDGVVVVPGTSVLLDVDGTRDAGLAGKDSDLASWSLADTMMAARALDSAIGREAAADDALERALNAVTEKRFEVERAVSDRLVLRQRTEGGLLVVDAVYRGRVLSLSALSEELRREVDRTATLLESTERELFESFLAGQIRREVTQRIKAADSIIESINALMENCPTASTMRVRLGWRVSQEAAGGTAEVVDLLRTAPADLADTDRAALEAFFRHRIDAVRASAGGSTWTEQLLEVLDYRRWHTFSLQRQQKDKPWEVLTRSKHAAMSGGEKAVALHLPLFAAAAAHYAAASVKSPRFILLDEVFAGVDAPMRGRLFKLACDFGLDMIATSESEQGTHADLDGIAIYQLLRHEGQPGLLAVRSVWDGRQVHRLLDADLAS
ncbi:TIGR02680 family protein [Actinacidiphila glaucinigra]|uniref:TIGR02680 family protein n=1 Tax=Actinacidiphila glaucinigra TaxID=235986 RepID=UPI003D8D53B7